MPKLLRPGTKRQTLTNVVAFDEETKYEEERRKEGESARDDLNT